MFVRNLNLTRHSVFLFAQSGNPDQAHPALQALCQDPRILHPDWLVLNYAGW